MKYLLYILAVILLIVWFIGFFFLDASGIIHLLLVVALISVLTSVIKGDHYEEF